MCLFAQSPILSVLIVAALALIILTLLIRSYRYFSRQRGDNSAIVRTARPPHNSRHSDHDLPADIAKWQVTMHETARQLSAQLESKMAAIGSLVADADRAASRLEAALRLQESAGGAGMVMQPPKPATDNTPRPSAAEHQREEIHLLSDYGYDSSEIASRVGTPIGEVERILSLRGKE